MRRRRKGKLMGLRPGPVQQEPGKGREMGRGGWILACLVLEIMEMEHAKKGTGEAQGRATARDTGTGLYLDVSTTRELHARAALGT